jgi:hypothetical protein
MARPNPNSNTQVAEIMNLMGFGEETARSYLSILQQGYDIGLKDGRQEVQRFFRLALGVDEPTTDERAYWNNPVPLKDWK